MDLPQWEYLAKNIEISDKWSAKKQRDEIDKFNKSLNGAGMLGWELVSYVPVPVTGSYSGQIRSYAYLALFKRPRQGV